MTLNEQLDRLAAFEPSPYPVISLYLNTQPNQHGRDHFDAFVRKELKARAATYPARSADREMVERDLERIAAYLESDVNPDANGVAIFACGSANLFETVQLEAPLPDHSLYVGDMPHLYPLARYASHYPRYVALIASTNRTRILVVADGGVASDTPVEGVKTRRNAQGGWSQARFQRRIENYHLQHIKEVIDVLEKIVTAEAIDRIVVAGDAVVIPLIREQMPKHLAEKVIDELPRPDGGNERDVIDATLESMRQYDERTDREQVENAVGAYRAGGLGVVGPEETLLALTNGQVDELLISASLSALSRLRQTPATAMAMANDASLAEPAVEPSVAGEPQGTEIGTVRLADELVRKAHQTAARVSFIEDASLLEPYGGVAATLRFRI